MDGDKQQSLHAHRTPQNVPRTFVHEFANMDPSLHSSKSARLLHSPESIVLSPTQLKSGTLPSDGRQSKGGVGRRSPTNFQPTSRNSSGQPSTVGRLSSRQISVNSSSLFEDVTYKQVDSEQRQEFTQLLKKESSWYRSCLHKGLVANVVFFLIMVLGIILGEVLYPLEGLRGRNTDLVNDTMCIEQFEACVTVRILRAIGVFGFLGGVSNWIAVEMLFRSIPFLIGTGVIAKRYKEIREGIHSIVVETLFDPVALKEHFSGRKKYIQEMLHLEHHFGSLLNSEAANRIIDTKIALALARPEGFILNMMGLDQAEVRSMMKCHIQGFLTDISPLILDKMAVPGLTDGAGMQAEMERILEERVEELSSTKVKQLIAIMIRKHLSWLIVWGNIFGALIGLVAEIVAVLVARYTDN